MDYTNLIDPATQEPGDLDQLTTDLTAEVAASQPATDPNTGEPVVAPTADPSDPLVGTKFEGKSAGDILEAYNNLHSAFGRQSNDLGVQRKLTDQLLDLKRTTDLSDNSPEPIEIDSGQLIDNPTAVVNDVLGKNNETVLNHVDNRLNQLEGTLRQQAFISKHPDVEQVSNDPKFKSWLEASPIRTNAAEQARAGDWDMADALISEFKTANTAPVQESAAPAADPNAAARQVGLETAATTAVGDTPEGKVYSRAALMRMRVERPAEYEDQAFQSVIMKAYAEGRVK